MLISRGNHISDLQPKIDLIKLHIFRKDIDTELQ
jgi:hypothetical protein